MSFRAIVNISYNVTVLKVNFVEIVRFFPLGQFSAFSLLLYGFKLNSLLSLLAFFFGLLFAIN